jgi:hypothetical protein
VTGVRWLTVFLDFPAGSFGAGVAFWREVTGFRLSPFRGTAAEFATLLPPAGNAYLRVQRTADGSSGHHLDLHIDPVAASVEQAAGQVVELGARVRHRSEGLVTAVSPGGFTFCLVRWHGEATVPGPVHLDDGGASRADQLCLDIPAGAFERERSFWSALTGWEVQTGVRSESACLNRPAGIPVRLGFQRADPGDRVTGHIDFACADRERLAARHVAAGARILAALPRQTTMADPTGRRYGLSIRDPETGKLPETMSPPLRPR